jgi:hypothetical protein
LESVEASIPPNILSTYRAARARNHAVNQKMVEWLGEGVFDFLLITQEDCSEFGLHRLEQDVLTRQVARLGLTERFVLHPGADEAALTLLARHWNSGATFRLHPSNPEDMERIAPFEDVPYQQSLLSHLAAQRGVLVEGGADFELFVNAPAATPRKEQDPEKAAARRAIVMALAGEIEAALEAGKSVALCDVAYPNGADEMLLRELEKRTLLGRLAAFAGWNTAGNTTGTLLAQCAALKSGARTHDSTVAQVAASLPNRTFVFERLLDDWCYQSAVRSRVEKVARDKGVSPFDMQGQGAAIETLTRQELNNFAHILAPRQFGLQLDRVDVTLPWQRTFEVELNARLLPNETLT